MAIGDVNRCAKCGYELAGLGTRGRCPECGAPFDKTTGTGIDLPLDSPVRSDRKLRRLRTYILLVLAVVILSCSGLVQLSFPNSNTLWLGSVFVLIFLMA